MTETKQIIDIDLAEDVKEFVSQNNEVQIEGDLKQKINGADNDELLKITKYIGSPTKIVNVEIVDDVLIEKELSE